MIAFIRRLTLCLAALCCLFAANVSAQAQEGLKMPVYQALTQTKDWLNTSRPLTEADLKGRIILVDFWTYCCINCIHVIPKLQQLEQEFGNKLTVIGVHSAKFATEGETANIREAIQKYNIEHPVVNDADFRIWNSFGVNAWPTLLLIAPSGLLKNVYRGEGDINEIRKDIVDLIKKNPESVTNYLPLDLEKNKVPPTFLRFPTKLASLDEDTLVISDSGHHRIVIADVKKGKVTGIVGKGTQGFTDGGFENAQFNSPQGVLAEGHFIYVADTGNHRLRRIDLEKKKVETLAGTGERGSYLLAGSADAEETALASPWDLAFYPDKKHILIANAGTHQLWSYDIAARTLSVVAGNGQESIDDGRLPFNSLSQPSGLSVYDGKAYFVDAETSSLRVFNGTEIKTLIGTGLFDFGLQDGNKEKALMQHATGLAATEDGVYVADTYNHVMRLYKDGHLTTLPIKGLKEPNAVIRLQDRYYVADTNNHRIVMMDKTGHMTGVLELMPAEAPISYANLLPNPLPSITQSVGTSIEFVLKMPKGWHLNPLAPSYLAIFDAQKKAIAQYKTDDLKDFKVNVKQLGEGQSYLIQGILYYCEDKEGSQCLIRGIEANLTVNGKLDNISHVIINLPQ